MMGSKPAQPLDWKMSRPCRRLAQGAPGSGLHIASRCMQRPEVPAVGGQTNKQMASAWRIEESILHSVHCIALRCVVVHRVRLISLWSHGLELCRRPVRPAKTFSTSAWPCVFARIVELHRACRRAAMH